MRAITTATNPVTIAVKVVRHGGRRSDAWKTLYEGADMERAAALYEKTYIALRQGCVALVDCATGKAMKQFSAPCLRSKW
jgi:hypothetical protein